MDPNKTEKGLKSLLDFKKEAEINIFKREYQRIASGTSTIVTKILEQKYLELTAELESGKKTLLDCKDELIKAKSGAFLTNKVMNDIRMLEPGIKRGSKLSRT